MDVDDERTMDSGKPEENCVRETLPNAAKLGEKLDEMLDGLVGSVSLHAQTSASEEVFVDILVDKHERRS